MGRFYKAVLEDISFRVLCAIFLFFLLWRFVLLFLVSASDTDLWVTTWYSFWWGASYQVIALFGATVGLLITRNWGGFKSTMGRATLMFSIGLLCQWFAQVAGAYLVWQLGTVPYPSLSDIGAFGALIFYAVGAVYLAKASGAHVSLRSYEGKFIAAVVPLFFLTASFAIFLRTYEYDWSQPLITFLDIGYPLGEAFYVSMAILAYLLSRKMLGGLMRIPILTFIVALVTEYVADFLFLYDSHANMYVPGGFNDLLFVISYSLMAISIIQLGVVYKWINES